MGKTRLVFEFLRLAACAARAGSEEITVLRGQCVADARQIPFFPFLEVLRKAYAIQEDDAPDTVASKLEGRLESAGLHSRQNLGLLLNLLGLAPPEGALDGLDGVLTGLRTRDLLPALLEAQCRKRMVILRLEDIHWMDTASEVLVQMLVENRQIANLLIVHTRRPEYLPDWQRSVAVETLALAPLAQTEIAALVCARLDVQDLPDVLPDYLIGGVVARAEGYPLFCKEILRY